MSFSRDSIRQFIKQQNNDDMEITPDEAARLVEKLQQRLNAYSELDLSPQSLTWLETEIVAYCSQLESDTNNVQAIVILIRELIAYIGQVLVLHAEGQWLTTGETLFEICIRFEGLWEVTKEGQKEKRHQQVYFGIGWEIVTAWDQLSKGKKPNFYKLYQDAKSKHLEEKYDAT